MVSLQPFLNSLLSSLPDLPVSQAQLETLIRKTLDESSGKSSSENRKSQWEYLLKNEIFKLAMSEGEALKKEDTVYYDQLQLRLDLVLTYTELEACEQTFPFIILQDLLETQTINSCSHVFSWIESRSSRLTKDMVPQKGKALILLRTLNDLLRRLSKSGSTTVFCGRILTFLSGVFPLGERSGVNLRGEYGPTWEDVWYPKQDAEKDVDMTDTQVHVSGTVQENAMEVDSGRDARKNTTRPQTPVSKGEDFYNTFWHLQVPFSKPPIFANKETFSEFKEAVNKVIPFIKEATAKERAMMGSRVGAGANLYKRKRDPEGEDTNANEYFFAKFLTSPDLLDLEIADTHFRRQFLFQLVILLHHLLTFTKTTKAQWTTPRNRSLQIDFSLEPEDAQWVQETANKALDELKQTAPNGRAFADTIQTILEREKNWVKWKNELCASFDKETWTKGEEKIGLFGATKSLREKMSQPREDWPHTYGTEPLTEIWQMGFRDLYDLENPIQPGDVKDFVKKIKLEDNRIEMRKKTLARIAERQAQSMAAQTRVVQTSSENKSENSKETPMDVDAPASTTPASAPATVLTPAPTPAQALSPTPTPAPTSSPAPVPSLHPSLPPRPGATPAPSQQPLLNTPLPTLAPSPAPPAAIPVPASAPTPTSAPVSVPTTAAVPQAPAPTPPPIAPPKKPEPKDPQIAKFEETKHRWAWLALRTARDQHLQHFGKIGTGDIELLVQEIEKEKQERTAEREKLQKPEDTASTVDEANSRTPVPEPLVAPEPQPTEANGMQKNDSDVKMEGQSEA